MIRRLNIFAAVSLCLVTLQLCWVFAMRPYAGMDEFDHAFRAASVARGNWEAPEHEADFGRGGLVIVPASMVEAASGFCSSLAYTKYYNCHAASDPDRNGNVQVASSASRYNPAYYWLVGTPALTVGGDTALYVMRVTSVVLCDIFLLLALWISIQSARTAWPLATFLIALTPVVLYSTSVTAPNGLQMCAGLLVWASAFALIRSSRSPSDRSLLATLTLGVGALVTTHTTGPMWAFFISATLLILPEVRHKLAFLWRTERRPVVAALSSCALLSAASLVWVATSGANFEGDNEHLGTVPMASLLKQLVIWPLQTIGALPFRNDHLPATVFATVGVLFGIAVATGFVRAARSARWAMLTIVTVFFGVAVLLSYISYDRIGLAWQGRYALPYALGLMLLTGFYLDQRPVRLTGAVSVIASLAFGVSQCMSILFVAGQQDPTWSTSLGMPGAETTLLVPCALAALLLVACSIGQFRQMPTLNVSASVTDDADPTLGVTDRNGDQLLRVGR